MDLATAKQTIADMDAGKIIWDDNKRAAANNAIGSGGGGVPNISLNDVGGSAIDFAGSLNAIEDKAFQDYIDKIAGQAQPIDIYTGLEKEAGLPQLRKTAGSLQEQIGSLEDTIRSIEPNVSATTRNSLVTEGQRAGMVQAQQKPFLQRLGEVSTSLGRVQQGITAGLADIGTKTGLVLQGQEKQVEPYLQRLNMLSDRAARLMTGFTSDRETRLSILMDKLQRQRQLEDREWQEASDLAKEERDYEFQFKKITATAQANTQVIEVGGRKKLINSATGAVIADLGSTSSGTGGTVNTSKYYNTSTYYGKTYTPPSSFVAD